MGQVGCGQVRYVREFGHGRKLSLYFKCNGKELEILDRRIKLSDFGIKTQNSISRMEMLREP